MQMQHVVKYGNIVIEFTLQVSDRRTVAISVQPDCEVIVKAPKGANLLRVQELVHKRARWIQKQKQYFQQFFPRTPVRNYVGGETHLYLGRQYLIKLITADKPFLKLCGRHLIIQHPDVTSPHNIEKILYAWYKSRAEQLFRERFEFCFSNFSKKCAVEVPKLHIRKMKSRWGSYALSGRMTLNLELIKASIDCIDYVITHELCHTVHPNHGPGFYKLLKSVLPDYAIKKSKLEQSLA